MRTDIEHNESRSHLAAWIIVVGLVVEAVLALTFPNGKTDLEIWSPVVANTLIALGVYGEIHFGGKAARAQKALQEITEAKLSETLDRATKAGIELELLKQQTAWRRLTKSQHEVVPVI